MDGPPPPLGGALAAAVAAGGRIASASARLDARLLPGSTRSPVRVRLLEPRQLYREARAHVDVVELRHGVHRRHLSKNRLPDDLDGGGGDRYRRRDRVPLR